MQLDVSINLTPPDAYSLGSTKPLTDMSTGNISGGRGRPARKVNNLTAIRESVV
jgi:hypothetical protein